MSYCYDGPGVYEILNRYNGDFYIGSSAHVLTRLQSHFRKLKDGKHENHLMQQAYNKHGADFVCFVLAEMPDASKQELFDAETKYIAEHVGGRTFNRDIPPLRHMRYLELKRARDEIKRRAPL